MCTTAGIPKVGGLGPRPFISVPKFAWPVLTERPASPIMAPGGSPAGAGPTPKQLRFNRKVALFTMPLVGAFTAFVFLVLPRIQGQDPRITPDPGPTDPGAHERRAVTDAYLAYWRAIQQAYLNLDPCLLEGVATGRALDEERGLVERRPHATDRRVKTVALTGAGIDMKRKLEDRLYEPPDALLAQRADASQRGAAGHELANRVAQELLLFGEDEIHVSRAGRGPGAPPAAPPMKRCADCPPHPNRGPLP